jgi:hypothetical protein
MRPRRLPAFQLGVASSTNGDFRGVPQHGAVVTHTAGTFFGVFQVGAATFAGEGFRGVAQIGLFDRTSGDHLGAQIGVVNMARESRGTQIGVFNVAEDLRGVQLGVVNWNKKNETIPVLPVMNLGW